MSGETVTLSQAPIPLQDPIARQPRPQFARAGKPDPLAGLLTDPWVEYFDRIVSVVDRNPVRVGSVELTGQTASIGATDLSNGALGAGLYQVFYYARITTAATTSSSLTVTLDWTDHSVAVAQSGAAITGNTTTTQQNGSLFIYVDSATPVRYSTTYASVGATAMQYQLYVALMEVKS